VYCIIVLTVAGSMWRCISGEAILHHDLRGRGDVEAADDLAGVCACNATSWRRCRGGSDHTPHTHAQVTGNTMQIVTGVEVSSEAYFPKLREYCPSAEGTWASTWAIFPQLREIRLTIDGWWQSLFVLLYIWSKWRRN